MNKFNVKFISLNVRIIILTILAMLSLTVNAQTDRKLVRDGNRMYHSGDYAKAEILYRKALSKNSENPQAVYNLGCALMMQNKDSAAIVQYQKAAKMEKNKLRRSMVWHNIGVVCQNHKMFDDAINAYEESLRDNPKDDETRYNLALCKRQQKKQNKNDQNKNNKDKNKQKDKNGQDKQDKQDKDNKDKNKDKKDDKQQQQPKEQMSKDNAEQLLNAAMQEENNTQRKLQKAMQHQRPRDKQKNW